MASDYWAGTFAEARDRTGGDESMPESNQSGNYDHIRCLICGVPWEPGVNERTGEMEPGHSADLSLICNRHRPVAAPAWAAEAIDRHERARDAACAAANGTAVKVVDAKDGAKA